MPQLIEVPSLGTVEFPDGLSDAEISDSIKKTLAKKNPTVTIGKPGEVVKVAPGIPAPLKQPLVNIPSFADVLAKAGSAVMAPISKAGETVFGTMRTATSGDVPPSDYKPKEIKAGEPMLDLPTVSEEDIKLLPKWLQGVAGVVNATTKAISGLTEPGNALIAPVAGVEGLTKPIAGAFLASAIASEPKAIQDAWRIYNDPNATTAQKSESIANAAVINPTFAALLTHGITSKAAPKPSLTPLTDEALKQTTGGTDAKTIRSDTGQPSETRPPVEGSKTDSGGNLQQAPSGASDATAPQEKVASAAIKVGDRVVTGTDHVTAYETAKATGTPDTSGAQEGFVTDKGRFISREEAAQMSQLPTETEPGKLHSSDLNAAKESQPVVETKTAESPSAPTPTPLPAVSKVAPVVFKGIQKGAKGIPDMEYYDLTEDIPGHPKGSTIGRKELESLGYSIPDKSAPKATPEAAAPTTESSPTAMKYKLIDQERKQRGLEPLTKGETVGDQQVLDKAMSEMDKSPDLADNLIKELNTKPRSIDAWERGVLLLRKIDLRNQFQKASEEAIKAADDKSPDLQSKNLRVAQLSDKLTELEKASRVSGSEQGRGLRSLQIMANEDFSLASLETQRRAVKGGEAITEDERSHLKKISEDYQKADAALQSHLEGKQPIPPNVIDLATKIIANLDRRADAAKLRIREKISRASAGVDPTLLIDAVEVGVAHAAHFGLDFAKWSAKMIEDLGDWVKPHLKDIFDRSQKKLAGMQTTDDVKRVITNPEERALKAFKTRTTKRIAELETKMATGDFSKTPRKATVLDREAMDLQAKKERVVKQFQAEQEKIRLAQRKPWEKALDFASDFKRFSVLTSVKVIPKLMSAGIQRLTTMPLEELIGSAWRHAPIVSKVAAKAPLEGGGFNVRAEMKGFGAAFTQGMKDAYNILKTGRSDLDILYGKGNASYSGETSAGTVFLEVPGRIHGMIKAPVKRAAFERSVQILGEFYAKQGLDVTDPLVKTRIATESYKAANRSIFLEDNRVVSAYKAGLSRLEGKDATVGSKAAATALKVALPIVRVPTNIAVETMRYSLGAIKAPVRIAFALSKGMENLKPEEADAIMRDLKKGSIGAAVLALGYYNAENIGGYYQPNKKQKEGDVKYGSVRIFGEDIPAYLLHNPLLETLQVGATVRKVAETKLRKKGADVQGIPGGVGAAAMGVTEQIPFIREMFEVDKLRNPYTRGAFVKQQAEDLIVPKVVQQGYQGATNLLNNATSP